jgi:pimeloyl-ACP methyl ester carboxylesterase
MHIEDLTKIAQAQTGPVILFGHSYGGVIAQGVAIKHPDLIDLVVTYESPTPWVLHRELNRAPLTGDARYEVEYFFTRMVSRKIWDRLSEEERESRLLDGEGLLSDLTALRTNEAPFDITKLKTPSAYIHGDGIIGEYYIALCKELNRIVPSMKTIAIEKANHGAHLQNPDQLSDLITELWRQTCA